MSVYHQLGHQCDNLISVPELNRFSGAIFSPADYDPREFSRIVSRLDKLNRNFELIFDPQLYLPRSPRHKLHAWSYFPDDLDTQDFTSIGWWKDLNTNFYNSIQTLNIQSICSPLPVPGNFSMEYYEFILNVGSHLNSINSNGFKFYQTVIVNLPQLSDSSYVNYLSSMLTNFRLENIYLIINSDTPPRKELSQTEEIKGAMRLINLLSSNDINIIIGYSSADIVLWKFAGAQHVATGKFFNLRRFTLSRWEVQEDKPFGKVEYLFEEGLLGLFRELDIPRLRQNNLISLSTGHNPFYDDILNCIETGQAWFRNSWQFYLYAFQELEHQLEQDPGFAERILWEADQNWKRIEASRLILSERLNDGSWIREWLRCVTESNFHQ